MRHVYGRWYRHLGGFIRVGNWSVALLSDPADRNYKPLTERHGTTRTWTVGPLRFRHHGRLYRRDV